MAVMGPPMVASQGMEPREHSDTGPTGAELAALVERAGCRIVAYHPLWSGRLATEIHCPTHRHKVGLLAALAEWDSKRPNVLELARQLAADTEGGPEEVARSIHEWLLDEVRFATEPRELFRSTERTLVDRYGDCDDASRALLALYRAAGLRAGLATLGDPPHHVAVVVRLGKRWLWAEPTVRGAQLGEHPRAAIRRTLGERPDLGGEPTPAEPQRDPTADELRAAMFEFGALALVALGARAAWDRKLPTAEEAALALAGGAWTPVAILAIRRLWARWSAEPPTEPKPTEPPGPETVPTVPEV